ncbi:chromatin structure-remodeling complex subunit RSC7 [Ophidiomyces ophidiicola]|nr:chromatin structure-remodeling complex subunit RSC7 [Ophidiomyces ophidiicola]KAI2440218.1 chromatin structure-remodeling complex subunit RSC7 [Ophidiomyces ophidiicola]KAI2458275.1 chromatin structure-remodeling complex subunit RSC7 [Ophidiomyces ophidiicola]
MAARRKPATRAGASSRRELQSSPTIATRISLTATQTEGTTATPSKSQPADSDVEMGDVPESPVIKKAEDPDEIDAEEPIEQGNQAEDEDEGHDDEDPDAEQARERDDHEGDEDEEDDEDDATGPSTPRGDSEQASRQDTPSRTPGRSSAIPTGPRRRRPGRPPKNRPPDWEPAGEPNEPRSDSGPPRKRGRGRPSAGGRWSKARGGPSHVTQVPVDKEGNMMDVVNDEVDLPEDAAGEGKVDKIGNLLGGREYRVRTFTILDRGDRLYMLSTEPARCIGFRDSYLFFQKHKLLYKIIIDDEAKRNLIERNIIPHSYKGRAIGVVTARSVFREFGAKIIIGGRKVIDDYEEKAARERGDVEGELAVPEDILPGPGETYDRNRYVAWHGASSVYHSGVSSVPLPAGKVVDAKKKKVIVTGDNWMIEHARAARYVLNRARTHRHYHIEAHEARILTQLFPCFSTFNSSLVSYRRETLGGIYDIHTNQMLFPQDMQPSHIRVERVNPAEATDDPASSANLIDSASRELQRLEQAAPNGMPKTNGIMASDGDSHGDADPDTAMDDSSAEAPTTTDTSASIFPAVAPLVRRHFAVQDVYYQAPACTAANGGSGWCSSGMVTVDPNTREPVLNLDDAVLHELPAECRQAYVDAAMREWEWKRQFGPVEHAPLRYSYLA